MCLFDLFDLFVPRHIFQSNQTPQNDVRSCPSPFLEGEMIDQRTDARLRGEDESKVAPDQSKMVTNREATVGIGECALKW